MRLSVRNGLKMIYNNTLFFMEQYEHTVIETKVIASEKCCHFPNTAFIFKKVKKIFNDLLLKQVKTTSLNKSNSIVFQERFLLLMLLYRKENSELGSYCRHNVSLSHLYISR